MQEFISLDIRFTKLQNLVFDLKKDYMLILDVLVITIILKLEVA